MQNFRTAAIVLTTVLSSMLIYGCSTKGAIESRELTTSVKMSETIFLEPVEPEQKVIWVHVRNTSDKQDFDPVKMEEAMTKEFERRGYRVTDSPKAAHYRLQANLLYADHEKQGLTEEGIMLGGFGGAILGGEVGGDSLSKTGAQVIGAVVGAAVGGIAGAAIHVDKYMLVVDVQIAERKKEGVSNYQSGESTSGKVTKEQSTSSSGEFINYRTRVVGIAKKTNLKWEEAQPILLEKFTYSLAGIF